MVSSRIFDKLTIINYLRYGRLSVSWASRFLKELFPWFWLIGLFFSGLWGVCTLSHAGAPQNVILMIGDGMGLESVWAAGAYQFGSDYHKFGGKEKFNFEKLAGFCWMTTYPLNLSTSPTNEATPLVSYDPTWTRGGKPGQLDYPRFGPELVFNGTARGEWGRGPGQEGGPKSMPRIPDRQPRPWPAESKRI